VEVDVSVKTPMVLFTAIFMLILLVTSLLVGCGAGEPSETTDARIAERIRVVEDSAQPYGRRLQTGMELSHEGAEAVTALIDALDRSQVVETKAILLESLAATDSPDVLPILRDYLGDPELGGAAAYLLGQSGDAEGLEILVDIAEGHRSDRFIASEEASALIEEMGQDN